MADKLTPDEVGVLIGEDVENIRDEEHPQGGLDEDMEGTGVDEPKLDTAGWDNEIEKAEADLSNPEWEEIDFNELSPEDRELYLSSVELRKRFNDIEYRRHLLKHKDDIFWDEANTFFKIMKDRTDDKMKNKSQAALYGLINTKMFELYQYI